MQKTYVASGLVLLLLGASACSPSRRDAVPSSGRESLTPLFPPESVSADGGDAERPGALGTATPGGQTPSTTLPLNATSTIGGTRGAGGQTTGGANAAGDGAAAQAAAAGGPAAAPAPPVEDDGPGAGSGGGDADGMPTGQAPVPATKPPGNGDVAGVSSFTDPRGDLTPSVDPPPPYADLAGGRLSRSAAGFELRVRAAGPVAATVPEDRTMNIASFFDVDGDGLIDYEIWANLADTGWSPAHFDNNGGGARFGKASGVAVEVAGDELVLRFPLAHLGDARAFRWSLASEWGRYEVISTPAAARDDAPDNDGFARFQG